MIAQTMHQALKLFFLLLANIAIALSATPAAVTDVQAFLSMDKGTPAIIEGRILDVFLDHADTGFSFAVLDCDGYFIYVSFCTPNPTLTVKHLLPLVGHRIRAVGIATPSRNRRYARAITRCVLDVKKLSDIQPCDNQTCCDFLSPFIGKEDPHLSELSDCGRRRAKGVVIARWQNNRIIMKRQDGNAMMVQLRDGIARPNLNTSIEVEGQPETDLYRIHFTSAIWRPSNDIKLQPDMPVIMPLSELFKKDSRFIINAKHYGDPVTICGTLSDFITDENGRRRLLLENDGLNIQVDCNETPDILNELEVGSIVSATGICVIDSDFWRPTAPFPKNKSLFLVTRTANDIAVVKGPQWWTPFRLFLSLCLIASVLVLITIWNITLRILVKRRSRELIRAQERKLESELRIGERTRLAADLHDSLSQSLTVIGYQISTAQKTLGEKDPETSTCLITAAKMIHSCRTDLRRCLWDLRNDVLDEPDFATAIRKTVEPVADEAIVQIRFVGRRMLLTDSTAHALLNIIRELVANAIRHGRATAIHIAGEVRPDILHVSVRDNGCGFDISSRPGQDEGHFGIDGIIERIERLQGSFELSSTPSKGTYARITIEKDKKTDTQP